MSPDDVITRPVGVDPVEPAAPAAASDGPTEATPASPPAADDEPEAGWNLGDEDPTAGESADKPAEPGVTTPSATEMAGDGAVEGDSLDTGWD